MRQYSSTAVETTLTAPISDSATSITLDSVSGFPVLFPYTLSIDADNGSKELVEVTDAAGTTLTVTRGVDGTSAVAHSLGAKVSHDHSARDFRESRVHEAATTGVHGASGAVIGADDLATALATKASVADLTALSGFVAVKQDASTAATLTGAQTLSNKTLAAPVVTGVGATVFVRKTTTETVTNSTTLQDDDVLLFTPDPNATYIVKLGLVKVGGDTPGFKYDVAGPTGSTVTAMSDALTLIVRIGSTTSPVKLRWAQNTASATPTSLFADSFIFARRVA